MHAIPSGVKIIFNKITQRFSDCKQKNGGAGKFMLRVTLLCALLGLSPPHIRRGAPRSRKRLARGLAGVEKRRRRSRSEQLVEEPADLTLLKYVPRASPTGRYAPSKGLAEARRQPLPPRCSPCVIRLTFTA